MITSSKATHPGRKKENNDSILIDDKLGLYILCDGSSDLHGKWLAETSIKSIHDGMKNVSTVIDNYKQTPTVVLRTQIAKLLENTIRTTAAEILGLKVKNPEKVFSYTTLDVVLILSDTYLVAHIGNGRIYLVREDQIKAITIDDTFHAQRLKEGVAPETLKSEARKHLTKVYGKDLVEALRIQTFTLIKNDIFVICSDGFYFSFENLKNISVPLMEGIKKNVLLDSVTKSLIDASVKNSTDDNTSVIVISNWVGDNKTEGVSSSLIKRQIELVRNFRMFAGIKDNDYYLLQVHALFTFLKIEKGKPIVTQGEESKALFILLSGKAEVIADKKSVAVLKPGDAIGEYGLFTGERRSATVIASEDAQMIAIKKDDLDAFCFKNVDFGYLLLKGAILEILNKQRK